MARLVAEHADPWPGRPRHPFRSLVAMILDQQLSTKAAATIRRRLFRTLDHRIDATALRRLDDDAYRAAGVSRAKVRYLRDLAAHVARGSVNLRRLPWRTDDDVVRELTQVTGVGPWTGEMYLIFVLGRCDVVSPGDVGLQNAVRNLYGLDDKPDADTFLSIAERWRPYRSLACLYLWRSLQT